MAVVFNNDNLEFRIKDAPLAEFAWRTSQDLSEAAGSEQMQFDMRMLDPGKYSYPYHYHRNAEELVIVMSGCMTMRTQEGFKELNQGDVVFFEKGPGGAHQFYSHTKEPCKYLDIRIKKDIDVCDYPDSGKVNILPYKEIYFAEQAANYFDGEDKTAEKWAGFEKEIK